MFCQTVSRFGHSELALNFIEYHPGMVALQIVIKVLPVDRRHTNVSQPEPVLWLGLAPVAFSQQLFQLVVVFVIVLIEIRGRHQP